MPRNTQPLHRNLNKYALYVFGYGAPTGLRAAMRRPERVTAIMWQVSGSNRFPSPPARITPRRWAQGGQVSPTATIKAFCPEYPWRVLASEFSSAADDYRSPSGWPSERAATVTILP